MVKKGTKRSLETTEAPAKAGVLSQGPPKKLKMKKDPKANGAPTNGAKPDQKNPKKAPQVQQNAPKTPQDAQPAKPVVKKIKKEKKATENLEKTVEQMKEQALKMTEKKLEARKKKKMARKEKRQENGQFKPENIKLTADEIKIRIADMKSRDQLSKTAKRKLAALQKKLRIEEGTYTPTAELPKAEKLSDGLKRKIRRHKMVMKRGETEGTEQGKTKQLAERAELLGKCVKLELKKRTEKAVKAAVTVEGEKISGGKAQKGKGKRQKVAANAEPESDDESEEEEVEGEDESEDDSEEIDSTLNTSQEVDSDDDDEEEEDSEAVDSTLNTSQEVDSDDDDDDEEEEDSEELDSTVNTSQEAGSDDDDDEEEEEEKVETKVKAVAPKPQKAAKETVKPAQAVKVPQQQQSSDKKTRYVLFVGNLPYVATQDDIKKHFLTKVSTIASVRIPTDNATNKPRGFAYVEFSNSTDYEKGLSLHESTLLGRRINVQYSQPGSKSSGKRPDVVAKNQKLHAMRKQGQLAGSVKDSNKRNFRRNQHNKSQG